MSHIEMQKVNNVCLVILTSIALTGALIYTKPVLVPFVLALFIYTAATPLVHWFKKRFSVPRGVAVLFTFVIIFGTFSLCMFLIGSSLSVFFKGAAVYSEKLLVIVDQIVAYFISQGIEINSDSIRAAVQNLPALSFAKQVTGGLLSFISNSTLISIFLIFLFLGGSKPSGKSLFISEIQTKISRYVVVKLLTSAITGIFVGILLKSFGVELAFMFAMLTLLLNFIPSIGSIIATLLPLPVLLLQFGSSWQVGLIVALLGVVQFGIGNVIEPKVMGESMDLHPVTVLAFLIFWGLIWGLPGMFLAVPITAILKIVLARIPITKNGAEILAGRIPSSWS